ncbi:MAG: N-acetylneuraminate synthase family protein [Ilumatobacteraceae bacterium]
MKNRSMRVDDVTIDDASKCFVIAEIGHNHQGNVETAKKMIQSAFNAGASAAKLQKRSNKSLFTQAYYDRPYNSENSFGDTYGQHREFLEFNRDQYLELQEYSEQLGIIFFATAFDFESADFLEDLGVPAFKVASGDLKNIPLIKYLASFGKPLFVSTGGGTIEDVDRVVEELDSTKAPFCIMQCTMGYPPAWDELNLSVISKFRDRYPNPVIGFSSHDNGIAMPVAAYALGARVVEKHFTLNRTLKGTDHAFSLEPQGMSKLVRDLNRLHTALGDGNKRQFDSEIDPGQKMGKKMVAARSLSPGDVLASTDILFKSPGDGLPPWMIDQFVGKRVKRALVFEQTLTKEDVD